MVVMVTVQEVKMIKPASLQGTFYILLSNLLELTLTLFLSRLMWRKKGEGEIYAYLPYSSEPASICGSDLNVCNPEYGYSLGRGSFQFKAGKWTHLRQVLTMNTPGKQDGQLVLYANGKKVFTQQKMIFRREPAGRVVGISKLFYLYKPRSSK